jgi:hypothetical protein
MRDVGERKGVMPMDTAHARRLGIGLTALLAVAEDAAGVGLGVGAALQGRVRRLARGGIGLPRQVARTLGREFDLDLGRIRLHVGQEVDAIAAGLSASAFCLGVDIFLSRSVLECGDAATLAILRHELTHVAAGPSFHCIRCWGSGVHSRLTEAVCGAFRKALDQLLNDNKRVKASGGANGLIKGLMNASSNMDVRGRAAPSQLRYLPDLVTKSLPTKMGWGNEIVGEGPAHGEGLNYKSPDWQKNTGKNVAEQTKHIRLAIQEFRQDQASWLDDVVPEIRLPPMLGRITLLEKEWVKSLANALHIAQDRASHREGVQGYGHNDKRCSHEPAWDPDSPVHDHPANDPEARTWKRCSAAAHKKALKNSWEVMYQFLCGIGMYQFLSSAGLKPGAALPEPEQCSFASASVSFGSAPGSQLPRGASATPTGFPNPHNQSVRGRSPGPLGVWC